MSSRIVECNFEKPDEGFLLNFQKNLKRKNLGIGTGPVLSSEIESKLSMISESIPCFNLTKLQLENHELSRQQSSPYTSSICQNLLMNSRIVEYNFQKPDKGFSLNFQKS